MDRKRNIDRKLEHHSKATIGPASSDLPRYEIIHVSFLSKLEPKTNNMFDNYFVFNEMVKVSRTFKALKERQNLFFSPSLPIISSRPSPTTSSTDNSAPATPSPISNSSSRPNPTTSSTHNRHPLFSWKALRQLSLVRYHFGFPLTFVQNSFQNKFAYPPYFSKKWKHIYIFELHSVSFS